MARYDNPRREALTSTPGYTYGRGTKDPVSQERLIGTGGHEGEIDKALRQPMAAAIDIGMRNKIEAAGWDVTHAFGVDEPPATVEEEGFLRVARNLILHARQDVPNGWGTLATSLANAGSGRWYGHWLAELRLRFDVLAPYGYRLEVFDIGQSSVQSWDYTGDEVDNGELFVGITQATDRGTKKVSAENIALITYGAPIPIGTPQLRSVLALCTAYLDAVDASTDRMNHEAGMLHMQMSKGAGADAYDAAKAGIQTYSTEDGTKVAMYGGGTGVDNVEYKYATGTATSPVPVWTYIDETVARVMQSGLQTQMTGGSGSRALGETLAEDDAETTADFMTLLGRAYTDAIMPWLARKFGYTGRLPVIAVPPAEVEASLDASGEIAVLRSAVEAKMLDPSSLAVRNRVLEILGFDPSDMPEEEPASKLGRNAPQWGYEGVGVLRALVDSGIIPLTPGLREYAARQIAGLPDDLIDALGLESAPIGVQKRPEEAAALSLGCSHDGEHVAFSGPRIDAFGGEFRGCKSVDEMNGTERSVRWGIWEDQRGEIDRQLASDLEAIAAEHREALREVLKGLPLDSTPTEVEDALSKVGYGDQYYRTVRDYAAQGEAIGAEHGALEQQEQVPDGSGTKADGVTSPELDMVARRMRAIANAKAGTVAQTVYRRVVGEMRDAWSSGADMATWETRQTRDGLASTAYPAATTGENIGRIENAAETERDSGLVVVRIVRTSVRDHKRCTVCAERDSMSWSFPRDAEQFIQDALPGGPAMTPDPTCEGAPKCRCGLIPEWGRPEDIDTGDQ